MPKLQVLPGNLANMIAAGEVVQRPASVVKELVENAVDAGSTSVTVVIADSGRTLIQVIDNGCGMSPEDAVLCFERHATSKIATPEDLQAILTYGFRGEALASIAAVAEVTLKTRRAQDELATQVDINSSGTVSTGTSAPQGSNFSVRNLFYNVPARRKFLKSDNVEFKHIVEEFTRISLTRPEVGFTLIHNGKEVFVLKPAKSLKFRVMDLLGSSVASDIVDIDQQTTVVGISGFVGKPSAARKTLGNQYFFVNGRYFRSAYLHKAVMKAYEEMIPDGLTPSYFIYLTVDPQSVDVNIHPTKTEIKFEEESVIFQVLYACVKETLGRNSFSASIDFDTEGMVNMPVMTDSFEKMRPVTAPSVEFDPSFDPFASAPVHSPSSTPAGRADDSMPWADAASGGASPHSGTHSQSGSHVPGYQGSKSYSDFVSSKENYGKLFEETVMPTTQTMTLHGRFILMPTEGSLMIIHSRRAQERILYERFLHSFANSEHVMQSSLFPVQVCVGVQNRLLLQEHSDLLRRLGFDITPYSEDSVVVGGVPEGYSPEPGKMQQMIYDILMILGSDHTSLESVMNSTLASKLAMLGVSSSSPVDNPMQARKIVEALLSCENAEYTSGGRRIIRILSNDEIEKMF